MKNKLSSKIVLSITSFLFSICIYDFVDLIFLQIYNGSFAVKSIPILLAFSLPIIFVFLFSLLSNRKDKEKYDACLLISVLILLSVSISSLISLVILAVSGNYSSGNVGILSRFFPFYITLIDIAFALLSVYMLYCLKHSIRDFIIDGDKETKNNIAVFYPVILVIASYMIGGLFSDLTNCLTVYSYHHTTYLPIFLAIILSYVVVLLYPYFAHAKRTIVVITSMAFISLLLSIIPCIIDIGTYVREAAFLMYDTSLLSVVLFTIFLNLPAIFCVITSICDRYQKDSKTVKKHQ